MKILPYLLTTLLLAILPWLWIPKGFVYTSEELNFINYDIKLERASSMWTKDYGFGHVGAPPNQSLLIPNAIFYGAAKDIGFNSSDTQKLFLSFIFLSISLGFYLFSSLFSKNSFIKSIGLLVYLFNFYLIASLGYTGKTLQLVLVPMIFYVTYKYLVTKRFEFILKNYLWFFVFQGVFTNLPLATTSILVYFAALLYFLFSRKIYSPREVLKNFLLILLSILPILLYQFIFYWPVLIDVGENPGSYIFTAIGVPLSLVIQLRGAWWERSGHTGVYYFNLWKYYGHPLMIALSSITVITVLLCSVEATWGKISAHKIRSTFWLSFYIFSLGLAAGFYFFPGFFEWLVNRVPLMVMFREAWAKFIPLVAFSFSAITIVVLEYLHEKRYRKYLALVLMLMIYLIFQSYPFISGKVIDSEVIRWKRRLVKIPSYWEEYGKWTESDQKVILSIPLGANPFNSIYNWYGDNIGNTIEPMPCVLGMTNVICTNNADKYTSFLKSFVDKKNFDFLLLGGVDLILIQDDLEIIADKEQLNWQREDIKELVSPVPIATFGGKLRLYQLRDQFIRPKIYSTQDVLNVDKNITVSDLPIDKFGKNEVFVFADSSIPVIKKTLSPNTGFIKVSQTEYSAKITEATDPFVLVFNEAYHKGWEIHLQDKLQPSKSRKAINNAPHLIINGFANGWYIEPKSICDNLPCEINLDVNFVPQRYFLISQYINNSLFITAMVSLLAISIMRILQQK